MLKIPDKIFYDKKLSSNEKIILMLIYSFNNTKVLSLSFIAKELSLSKPTVHKSLDNLRNVGLIYYDGDVIDKYDDTDHDFNS